MRLWAQIAQKKRKKYSQKKSLASILSEGRRHTFSYLTRVLSSPWNVGDRIYCWAWIYYCSLSRWKCEAAETLAYLEQCVSDLCSNGILIDTMGADDTSRLPSDDAGNTNRATQCLVSREKNIPFLSITPSIICMILFSRVHSPTWLRFARCGFKAESISN